MSKTSSAAQAAGAQAKAGKRAPPASSTTSPVTDFEACLAELETLVARMEQGELNLDDSLGAFERGITLFKRCQQALDQAELKVQQLLEPGDPDSALPFQPDADDRAG
ncbi:MAG: exodeoxyribonuclease VII small subunit [Xanthomonadales bacterium]|nr:exodeoxyribonuclease VII small subunit [Xanthomonadales bacterium]